MKNGSQLLDRLVKDIVTEAATFDIERFIPLLKERIYVTVRAIAPPQAPCAAFVLQKK